MTLVLVIGGASWNRMVYVDALPQGTAATIFGAHEKSQAGSTGVGKAMVAAALGHKTLLHCALGRDEYATEICKACDERGIDLWVDAQDGPTPQHLNIMDKNGGRYSILLSNGPETPRIDEDRLALAIAQADIIFLSLCSSSKVALPLLESAKAEIHLDLHDYDGQNPWYDDFISYADVVQISDVALPDPLTVISRLLRGRAKQVILTKGGDGAEVFTETDHFVIPPCSAQMRDSNGAGDAFSVAFWHGQQQGFDLTTAGKFAASAAAVAVAVAVENDALFPKAVTQNAIANRM